MSEEMSTLQGRLPMAFANTILEVIDRARHAGMEPDEICCVAASVVADYARLHYGDGYLKDLAEIVETRAGMPGPEEVTL